MSLSVKAALLATRDLRGTDRLVVLAIAAHTNTAGDAWPSVGTIAEYVGCSERTVQRCLARLVQAGRLAVRKVAGIATRVYRLVVDAVQGVTSAGREVTDQRSGVSDPTGEGDTHDRHPKLEEGLKREAPGSVPRDESGRLAWWRLRRTNPDPRQRPSYERRGAALPPAPGGDRCQRPGHVGQPASRCIPCRSEALGSTR